MNIALVFQHKLMQGLQRLMGDTANAHAQYSTRPQTMAVMRTRPTNAYTPRFADNCIRVNASPAQQATTSTMPLRVLRVVDKDQPRSCTGRLVISGRMADVCAELDRLVAREAAMH